MAIILSWQQMESTVVSAKKFSANHLGWNHFKYCVKNWRQNEYFKLSLGLVEFTDEEGYGKYLDLHELYDMYLNLKGIEVLYVAALQWESWAFLPCFRGVRSVYLRGGSRVVY